MFDLELNLKAMKLHHAFSVKLHQFLNFNQVVNFFS